MSAELKTKLRLSKSEWLHIAMNLPFGPDHKTAKIIRKIGYGGEIAAECGVAAVEKAGSRNTGDLSAANRALELVGKELGMFLESGALTKSDIMRRLSEISGSAVKK